MPYPCAIVIGHIPFSADDSPRKIATDIWLKLFDETSTGLLNDLGVFESMIARGLKRFYWTLTGAGETVISESVGSEECYQISVGNDEIVIDLV